MDAFEAAIEARAHRLNQIMRSGWVLADDFVDTDDDTDDDTYDDTDDFDDGPMFAEDEGRTSPIVFDMRYRDARKDISQRKVRLLKITYHDVSLNFGAWCYLRDQYRTFKATNVVEITDLTTGEVFGDCHTFFTEAGVYESSSPEYRALQICADDLAVLSFIGGSDGYFSEIEQDEVVKHVFDRVPEELNELKIRRFVRSLAPDPRVFRAALTRIKGRPAAHRPLLRSLRRVIDADRHVHAAETMIASEVLSRLGG